MRNKKTDTIKYEAVQKHRLICFSGKVKKWLSYVEGIRKDLDMGIVVNLDHAISLMMGKDEAIDEKARKSSVLLMLK